MLSILLFFQVTTEEIYELVSNQEETDTLTVLYLNYAAKIGFKAAVIRTPDTDILMILLHDAQNIPLTVYVDIGTGKNRTLVNVSDLADSLGNDYCTMALGLYVYTGENATSAFRGKGKLGPLKKFQSQPKY